MSPTKNPPAACRIALIVVFFLCLGISLVQAQRSVPAVKLTTLPTIDGRVNDAEWTAASKFDGAFDEQTGQTGPWRQEFWLGYDEKYIYIAARLEDPEPGKIAATEYRTNVSLSGDDRIVFAIDPFGTFQGLNEFNINPRGATQLNIAGGRAPKREWVGEIQAVGRVTERGWECEARIPWAIMKLPPPGARTARVEFGRSVHRTSREYITSNISSEQIQNISKWTDVAIPRSDDPVTLKLLPYGYGGYRKQDSETIANGGLDLKTSLNDGLEFVGTVNPDFRNIENNVLSLDFSYFERLAGESRPFFIEGSEYFRTAGDASLFASQRIRTFDAGMKIYGKFNDRTTVGFINTNDFGNVATYVGNVGYQIGPRESFRIAGTLLDRPQGNNTSNFLSYNRAFGHWSFFGQVSTTQDDTEGDGDRFNAGFIYEREGMTSFIEYQQISPDFLPRLGFAPERNYKGWNGEIDIEMPSRHPQILETEFSIGATHQDDYDGNPFRRAIDASASLTLRDQTDFDIGVEYEEIEGFKDRIYYVSLERPRNDAYRGWAFDCSWGEVAGDSFELYGPSFRYRPIQTLQLSLRHQELDHIERSRQTIFGMNYELNKFESLSGRMVRRDDDTNFYLAWRRAGNRGIEYYVIVGDPNARTFQTSVIVKAVIPIEVVLRR